MIVRTLSRIEDVLCKGLLGVLFILMFAHIFWRYVLNAPLTWSEELALILFIWLVFFGSSLAIRKHSHLVVDFIQVYLSRNPTVGLFLSLFIHVCLFAVIGLLWILGLLISIKSWDVNTTALQWPLSVFYIAIPVSCTFMIIWLIIQTREIFLKFKN
jgi:TRAP-type C4-dicarboxylate transport system permease small subunit